MPPLKPLCMSDDEYQSWQTANDNIYSKRNQAPDPCHDCTRAFAAEMRAEDRCDGIPGGGQQPDPAPMPHAEVVAMAAKAKHRAKEANIARAVELHMGGLLHREIAAEMGASVSSVGKWLKAWRTAA